MRNKILHLLVVIAIILMAAACGGGNETPTPPPLAVLTSTPNSTPYLIIDASRGVGFGYTWGNLTPGQSAEIRNPCEVRVDYIGIIAGASMVDIDIAGGTSYRVLFKTEGKQDPITCGPGALYVYRNKGVVFVEYVADHGKMETVCNKLDYTITNINEGTFLFRLSECQGLGGVVLSFEFSEGDGAWQLGDLINAYPDDRYGVEIVDDEFAGITKDGDIVWRYGLTDDGQSLLHSPIE